MKKIIEKLKWRGITAKDFFYGIFCLALMGSVTVIMAYSLLASCAT